MTARHHLIAVAAMAALAGCASRAVLVQAPANPLHARSLLSAQGSAGEWPADPSFVPPVALREALFADPGAHSRHAHELHDALTTQASAPARMLEALSRQLPSSGQLGFARREREAPQWVSDAAGLIGLPEALRLPIRDVLIATAKAEQRRTAILSVVPRELTPARLMAQVSSGPGAPADYRADIGRVDLPGLVQSAAELLRSVERLRRAVERYSPLPAIEWRLETPLGLVLVDTTGRDNVHRLQNPLLVVDVGGSDTYWFESRSDASRISIVLDHGGNDTYEALAEGADPSAGILGIGVLWDTVGNDMYRGGAFAQASAAFGVAVLIDEGGNNRFEARAYSQAHALAGLAVLLAGTGDDRYVSVTASQASAGPGGVALLMDRGGNDHYQLANAPLIRPSPQLAERNVSMGQGAGYGIRVGLGDRGSGAGGLGALIDLAGNDHYDAQVFAQGVAYQGGVGMLIDSGGSDRFEAAWYAQGAAAHSAAGLLLKRGQGNDVYRVSHVMGLGAAHDFSAASFEDEGGDDAYSVGDLGLAAAHDNGLALFIDAAGANRYELTGERCRGFGVTDLSQRGTRRDRLPSAALFQDASPDSRLSGPCATAWPARGWRLSR